MTDQQQAAGCGAAIYACQKGKSDHTNKRLNFKKSLIRRGMIITHPI
jgi:hypothetical protein